MARLLVSIDCALRGVSQKADGSPEELIERSWLEGAFEQCSASFDCKDAADWIARMLKNGQSLEEVEPGRYRTRYTVPALTPKAG